MAIPLASERAVCSVCGERLNAKGDCVACLLRMGFKDSIADGKSDGSIVFGDFEIARHEDGSLWELGRGAMGVTYLAIDQVLHRKIALKVIEVPQGVRGSEAVRERFLREARAAAVLRHPNVAAVYQFGASADNSRCFYAMELVEGETLETRVRKEGPLNSQLVVEIGIQIAGALIAASGEGLIHRDLKPSNIMLKTRRGAGNELEVKIIDFGLAKAIANAGGEMDITHGEFVGTPNFASPEQFESVPLDVRSDIYSLGCTLWFALTGKNAIFGSQHGGNSSRPKNRRASCRTVENRVRSISVPVGAQVNACDRTCRAACCERLAGIAPALFRPNKDRKEPTRSTRPRCRSFFEFRPLCSVDFSFTTYASNGCWSSVER